jgi:hypothetical protein
VSNFHHRSPPIYAHRPKVFAKKIPLHHQLPDLRVQLFHLAFGDGLGRVARPGERPRHPVDRLAFPRRYHRVVHAVLGRQLRQRQVTPDRFKAPPWL